MLLAKNSLHRLHHQHVKLLSLLPPSTFTIYTPQPCSKIRYCHCATLKCRINVRQKCPSERIVLRPKLPADRHPKNTLCGGASGFTIGHCVTCPVMDKWVDGAHFRFIIEVNERI